MFTLRATTSASHGCPAEQIGAILDCDHRTIERRFAPISKKRPTAARWSPPGQALPGSLGYPLQHRDRDLSREKLARKGRSPGHGGQYGPTRRPQARSSATEETKKRLVDMSLYIRREALLEQQRLEALGNAPNGPCRGTPSGRADVS
jgi:hypothetical protein